MSIPLRTALLICAALMAAFTVNGIRKSRMNITDSLFWAGLAALILILGMVPQIGYAISDLVGFSSPVNFVFAFFIGVLTVKCFTMSRRQSDLENKNQELIQRIAVERLDHYERAREAWSGVASCEDIRPHGQRAEGSANLDE